MKKNIIIAAVISAFVLTACGEKAKESQAPVKPEANWTKSEPLNFKGKGMKIDDPGEGKKNVSK